MFSATSEQFTTAKI